MYSCEMDCAVMWIFLPWHPNPWCGNVFLQFPKCCKSIITFIISIYKISKKFLHYDWSVWVHYIAVKHAAYFTCVHYSSTYARELCQNFLNKTTFETWPVRHYGWRVSLFSIVFRIFEYFKKPQQWWVVLCFTRSQPDNTTVSATHSA